MRGIRRMLDALEARAELADLVSSARWRTSAHAEESALLARVL